MLNVYDKDANGNPQNYIQKDVEVKDNKFTVDNAVTGTIYYYTVSAKKGEHVSMPSVEVQVKGIVEPVLSVSSPINGDKYTAEWKNVGGAERYNYISYFKQEATEDCLMEVSKLNLVGMKYDSDDMEVEYSVLSTRTRSPSTHSGLLRLRATLVSSRRRWISLRTVASSALSSELVPSICRLTRLIRRLPWLSSITTRRRATMFRASLFMLATRM